MPLEKRRQNLSVIKFVIGILLLGFLGYVLDLQRFIYTQEKDIRDLILDRIEVFVEGDPEKISKYKEEIEEILSIDSTEELRKYLKAAENASIQRSKAELIARDI